jgi:hypothetical protein
MIQDLVIKIFTYILNNFFENVNLWKKKYLQYGIILLHYSSSKMLNLHKFKVMCILLKCPMSKALQKRMNK